VLLERFKIGLLLQSETDKGHEIGEAGKFGSRSGILPLDRGTQWTGRRLYFGIVADVLCELFQRGWSADDVVKEFLLPECTALAEALIDPSGRVGFP
jgi:hypothetical protein